MTTHTLEWCIENKFLDAWLSEIAYELQLSGTEPVYGVLFGLVNALATLYVKAEELERIQK